MTLKTPARRGFTMVELALTLVIFGLVTVFALSKVGGAISRSKVDRAASVVAADFELAFSTAGRLRQPVRLTTNFANKTYQLNDVLNGGALRFSRDLGVNSQFVVDSIRFTPDTVRVLPPGRGSNPIQADIWAGGKTRRVTMSTAGFVRIVTP